MYPQKALQGQQASLAPSAEAGGKGPSPPGLVLEQLKMG